MELSELRLKEPMEILPGVCKATLILGSDKIDRMELVSGMVIFKIDGQAMAIVWVVMPGTVMMRDLRVSL